MRFFRPGIILSHPDKIVPHNLIKHGISCFFCIVQSGVSPHGVDVCSSWSNSIWVTMLRCPNGF